MRKLLMIGMLFGSLSAFAATPKIVTLDVQHMTCELCPITVRKSLEKVVGVTAVKVDFDKKNAVVTFDAEKIRPEVLIKATTDAGYPSTLHQ